MRSSTIVGEMHAKVAYVGRGDDVASTDVDGRHLFSLHSKVGSGTPATPSQLDIRAAVSVIYSADVAVIFILS